LRTLACKVTAALNAFPGVRCPPPKDGFYVFADFSAIEPSSQNLFKRLLDMDRIEKTLR
jgi:aspartate/methionine/tyrosine aminotransferase